MLHPFRSAVPRTLAALVFVVAACGGSTTAPPPVTPTPVPPPPAPPAPPSTTWSTAGRVTAFGANQGLAGATVAPRWELAPVVTDGQGAYQITDTTDPPFAPYPLTVSAPGMLTREMWISWTRGARTGVDITLIRNAAPFSMTFYQQFARDMYDKSKGSPWPLRRWTTAPKFYLRTLDQAGRPVEPEVLSLTIETIRKAVPAYTANTYTAAAIETGTEVRPAAAGWINVDFKREFNDDTPCGRAFVGENPGTITLYEDQCSCGSIKVPPSVTTHEVGHAMGFFHVSDRNSVMYPYDRGDCRHSELSSAESYHAAVMYSRPRGNTDPDKDPSTGPTLGIHAMTGPLVR